MSHCLRPHEIVNPHFNPKTTLGAKNLRVWRVANNSPHGYPEDYHVLIDCGTCLGCLRDKARSWRVRLLHEHMFGNHDSCTCLTLTIAPEHYEQFQTKAGMASAMRAFIDRLRYYTPGRCSPKRFFISELGEDRGRLHFHGFIWDCNIPRQDLERSWRYGFICARPLRSAKQLSYATKYIQNTTRLCRHETITPKTRYIERSASKEYTYLKAIRTIQRIKNRLRIHKVLKLQLNLITRQSFTTINRITKTRSHRRPQIMRTIMMRHLWRSYFFFWENCHN